jgi:hypothetical protein
LCFWFWVLNFFVLQCHSIPNEIVVWVFLPRATILSVSLQTFATENLCNFENHCQELSSRRTSSRQTTRGTTEVTGWWHFPWFPPNRNCVCAVLQNAKGL